MVAYPVLDKDRRDMNERSLNELVYQHVMGLRGPHSNDIVPSYSGEILTAWRVMEKMYLAQWRLTLMQGWDGKWNAQFHNSARMGLAVEATAPEAICRAALRALEVPGA